MHNVASSIGDEQVISWLRRGLIGVIPTDTIYGLVAPAADQAAVNRLYAVKKRDGKPGTIIAANTDQLISLGISREYIESVARYWPNPISIVLPASPELSYLHRNLNSLAVRVVSSAPLRELLLRVGPLLTSSANMPGDAPANNINEAQVIFGDDVDFYVDGGELGENMASTVARLNPELGLEILRQGYIKIKEL